MPEFSCTAVFPEMQMQQWNSFWLEHLPTIPVYSVITIAITMRNILVAEIMEIVTHCEKCNLNLALVWFRKDKTRFFGVTALRVCVALIL